MKYSKEDYLKLEGEIWALQVLANEVRLDCRRMGWSGEAALIQAMQDGLKALYRAKMALKKDIPGDF